MRFGCGIIDRDLVIEVFRELYGKDFHDFDKVLILLLMNISHLDIEFRVWKFYDFF